MKPANVYLFFSWLLTTAIAYFIFANSWFQQYLIINQIILTLTGFHFAYFGLLWHPV